VSGAAHKDPEELDLLWELFEEYVAGLRDALVRACRPERVAAHDPRALQWPWPLQGSGWRRFEAFLFNFGAQAMYGRVARDMTGDGLEMPPMDGAHPQFQQYLHCYLDAHRELLERLLREDGLYAGLRRGGFKRLKGRMTAIQGRALEGWWGFTPTQAARALGCPYSSYMRLRAQYERYRAARPRQA